MAKFVFPLQGVLRQRELVEEQRQRELAVVQAEMAALEAELRGMDQSVQTSTADLRDNHLVGRLDLAFLTAHRRYALAMQRKAVALAERMAAVRKRLDAARAALAEAAKQRKIIEKLRDSRKAQWEADLARKETAAMDEIAGQIGYRNSVRGAASPVPPPPGPVTSPAE